LRTILSISLVPPSLTASERIEEFSIVFGDKVSTCEISAPFSFEATSRPGFFSGVATILIKLFNIVQPNSVYFGQKDAIQCILVRRLVKDFNYNFKVNICSTFREIRRNSRYNFCTKAIRNISN